MAVASETETDIRDVLGVRAPDEIVEWLNIMVYGAPGAGKTYFAGTASELGKTLVFDVEGGATTLRKMKGIDAKPVRSMDDIVNNYNLLYKSIKDNKIYYDTVVIDSITELADLDMKEVMKKAYNANPDKVDIDVPSPREWGKVRNHIRNIVRAFRDLPCHVIFIAGLAESQEDGQPKSYAPAFAGKLRMEVPGFVDIVGYLTAENEFGSGVIVRKLQVTGTRRVVAKDRTAALGDLVEAPSIPKIWELIEASN